ncbi:spore photoproduct lyase family protein [Roseomonas sp. SSH11]|uniref:Spore photoproduct lyase family protein n=1 Tax=Pararoseomonas baculiformis TaxID=2820812 RepID=A0ABS4AB56_9PROT|nr:spore photoproduct lyase family protein [Pararoseomonas baculiformis]MBP0444229.1 spore photoproduct lyase family protein [Pararoseomonas baculiformis]
MTPPPPALLDIARIYLEPAVEAHARGRDILARFPEAERIPVASHWRIPELREGDPGDYLRAKRESLVLGVKKGLAFRPNGRSADFIAPSSSNGCAMACAYCYVARRKGHSNPISVFVNIEEILAATARHAAKLGPKAEPNQVDPRDWVYDLGENGDLSVDAMISDNVRDLVALFRTLPNAKGSFATKWVNRDLLDYDPRGRTRIRMSLMPPAMGKLLDVRTSPMAERIAIIPELHRAGYEVHLNFSPVVLREGWEAEWGALFEELDDVLPAAVKEQLAAEVIMLTHNQDLHEINLAWHPKAEELLWRPDIQEEKVSEAGGVNLRYRTGWKGRWLQRFKELLAARMPYCRVRYAF